MTSYDLSMFDTPRQPKAPEAKYDLSMLDQGQPKTIWQPLQPEQVQAATTIASFGDATKSANMDKLRSELRQYLGDDAPMVGSLNFEDAQRQLQRAQMDHTLRDSPHTARWFTEQVQQGKTPYDVGTLANIERVTRVAPLLLPAAAGQSYAATGGTIAIPGAFFDVVAQALEPMLGKLPKSELTNLGNFITEYGKRVAGEVPDDLNVGEKGLVSAAGSLGAFATALPMAVFGLPGVLWAMSAGVGGSTYLENLKTTGNAATAMFHGILDAGYEYIFERMGGTGVLFDKAAWAKGLLGLVAKFVAREIPTELATTVAQKADQYILQNPERTFEQFMSELPEDLAVTAIATLVGGGGQVALFKAVDKLADLGNTTAKAQVAHDNLAALLDNVAKSELYLNDPDTFAQFFQGVAGDATVTVDPVKLVEAMTAANVTEEALPSLKDQLNAPGEIELTVQELATAFAGTGAETTLLQHVRPEPDLPTLAESKEQTKAAFDTFQEAGEKAMARFQADEVANAALDAIQEDVAADVQATGMFGPHYARGYGTLMRHFYATMAKAHGVTPLQFRDGWVDANGIEHRGYNARVVGPTGQVRGRSPATVTDFKPGRIANLRNRDNWAVLEAGNPSGTEATPEENAASMAKLKAYLDKEGIEYHDAKGSYFGTKADSLMLLGVTAERASEIGNMFGQESVVTRHGLVFGDGTVAQATGIKEVKLPAVSEQTAAYESEQAALAVEATDFKLPAGYAVVPDRGRFGFSGNLKLEYEGKQIGYLNTWFDHVKNEVRIDKVELDAEHQGKKIAKLAYIGLNKALAVQGLGPLGSDTRSMTQSAINLWKSLVRDGLAKEREDGRIGYEFLPEEGSATEDHTFLPAFGSAFRLEIPESAFENRVKLNEVLNQSVSTRTPTQKAGRGDPHLTTDLDVDYNVVEQDADLVARMATVVKTYPGIKKGLRNPNKIVEAFIKHVEDNLSWLYDNVPPEIRERSKLWYDGGRRIIERWTDKYGFTDAQIAGVIAVLSPQTEWDMNVTRAERILDIWTQQQDFAWSDEMNAEADAIDSIKPVLREAIRGKKLSELDSDLLRGVWIRVYDQAHNPRVVRGITPEGGFAAFKKTMAGKQKTSTWGSFAEIGKAVRILRDGSTPNISRSLGGEHKVRNFYNNLFDPSDSRSVTIDTHAVAAGLLRPLAGGSIEVGDNLGARPRHDQTGTNGTYVLYAEAYRRAAMAKGVLPRELQSITWEAVRRLFPDSYKSDATRAEIDALWKPNETGKESADEIRSKILDNRGGRIPNPAWERSGTGLDVGQPSSTYQSGILERSWADGTPGTRAGGYFAQTVPATGKPAGLTITGVHFSPGEQTSLLPSKYGKGLEGAERARVMASKDARIKRRTHFYVNTGQGVFPEYGVGAKAHVSELTNLYDADVDALGLFKGKTDEQLNAAESAVLDAGYSGYVMRGFGNQGAAVVFGARVGDTISTKFVGGKEEANVPVAPAAQYSETQRLRQALTTSKDLPHGAMTAARWREYIGKVLPDLLPKIEASGAFERVQGMVYRDELARAIEPPEGQFYQKVWHGTPHIWAPEPGFPHGRPRLDKMGTGEGAQAFGWGWYSAESHGVATSYRNKLADSAVRYAGFTVSVEGVGKDLKLLKDAEVALRMLSFMHGDMPRAKRALIADKQPASAKWLEENIKHIAVEKTGALYQLDIPDASLPYLLDWDKSLSEQTKEVRDAINTVAAWKLSDDNMAMSYKGKTGRDFYEALVALQGSKKNASNVLARLGIVGNRYLDGQSRDNGEGSYNYVIWDQPTLDKIALLERNGEKLDAMQQFYQAGWYSPLTRAFQNAKQATMPGSQWASWLAGNKAKLGLKDDEIVFSGLDNYLELRGKDKVTREEIVDYLMGNGVRVEEKVLGGAQGTTEKDLDNAEVEARRTGDWTAYEDLVRRYEDEQIGNDANGSGNKTLYASYVPPGGIPGTYREILVTLPARHTYPVAQPLTRAEQDRQATLAQKMRRDGNLPATEMAEWKGLQARARAHVDELDALKVAGKNQDPFRSAHWGEPNVLVHLRVDEAEGVDGQRVLRVIEVQSDWGQKGKKEGFVTGTKEEWLGKNKAYRDAIKRDATGAELDALKAEVDAASAALEGVTASPFVTDTKAWVALGIKRASMHAVDVGATGVVFATGEQNAALYDLSKQVDKIEVWPQSGQPGTFVVTAWKNGSVVSSEKNVSEEKLPDVIGKEPARAAMADLQKRNGRLGIVEGLDLKVGGEGMKAFYDKIVPQVANDVLKKLGAGVKVEKFIVPTPVDEATTDRALVMDEDVEHFGFSITPEFRAKVMEGVPLFQVKPAYAVRSPDGKYQGIRELTDKEARELIDLGYQVNRVTPGYGQAENAMGGFNPSTLEITLLAKANPSTFLHETGHFFLTAYADMASQEGAPQQIVDDMNALLKMFGIADLATWNNMSTDEQRPYHEQFAESFEQYLFSGKAPTKDLQTLFRRFATWLTKVYGSIKEFIAGHPGAQLNPELEAILGRMLATEAEIAAAEDNRNYEALFRTAAEAGMTPAQFAVYLDLPEEARAVAEEQLRTRSLRDMKWLQNRKNKTVAALQKEAAAVRAEVRKEVAETVAQEPIFRALRWLKRGELTNPDTGEEVKVTAGNKLSIPALEEMYPEGALGDKPDWRSLGYGQYGMLANEGLHPDVVADMFGFDSGAALVDALVNAPKFKDEVEGRTDQIMLERHGDLSSPDKIAQAADEAIHNEVRTKIVATELSFLDKLTGSPSFLIKAAKEYARQLVANRTSKTLKAWVFAADEVRASKAAAAALKKGDTKAAANHKRVELLNHTAVREAHAAEKELKKIVDRLRKIASYKDDDSSAKARDMDMVNAVRVVLYRFGLGTERKGKTATEYLSLVEANDPAMGAALRDLVDSTTDNAKDWRDLKLSELRDLHDAVESVWALAKRSRQMEVDGKLVPRRQVEQELYDRLDEIGIPDTMPGETSAVTESERNWMKFSTFVAALRRVESWVEAKDGKAMGPFRKYIWSQIKAAADTYRVKKAEYLKAYRELLDTIAPTLKRELIDAREIGYTFGKGEGGMGMVELLHAILHTGNASNKRKLLLGRGWATDNGDGTMDTSKWDAFITRMIQEGKLTKAHYDFAQGVWDMLDGMKPAAQKAHRSVFGRYFAEVTADAFTTPFGDYRGGYVPAQADPEIVQDAQLKELANQENENMVYAFPSTPKGFTKSRVEYNRPLRLDLRSLAGHIDKVLLFSYLTEPVSDVRRVLISKTVSQALGRVDPKAIGSILTPWLNRTAKQIVEDRVPGREPLARFWSAARARAGMSAMFANLANSAQQITGVSLAALKVRPKYLLEALAHGVASPRKLSDHVASVSPYMRDRMHNDIVLMGEAIDEILLNPTLLQSAKAWSSKHAYFMQRAVDNFFSPMVWMGAFNQAKENGSDDLEARRLADSAVRETMGSQAPEDIAAFEQGTAFYRMFVQFAGYFNMNANLLGTEFVKLSQDMGLKKGAGRGLYVLALGFYVPAVLGELIIQAFRGGPDDDDKDGEYLDDWLAAVFGYGPARYLTAMVPVVGQAANALVNTLNHKPYDDRISTAPAISMIESAVKAPISVYKAIADEGKSTKAINDTATLISMTVGVPARAVAKPISYLTGVANEEIAPEDTYDAIRGTITGTASPGSKQ